MSELTEIKGSTKCRPFVSGRDIADLCPTSEHDVFQNNSLPLTRGKNDLYCAALLDCDICSYLINQITCLVTNVVQDLCG